MEVHILLDLTSITVRNMLVSKTNKSLLIHLHVCIVEDREYNNLNTVSGITMLMVNSICSMFGIPSKQFFSGEGEDFDTFTLTPKPVKFSQFTDQGLNSLVKTIENNTIDLKLRLADLTTKVDNLEKNLGALQNLDKIVNSLLQLDPTKINLILDIVKNIDQKV